MSQTLDIPRVQPDHDAIKRRQQATWASGDYTVIGTTLQIVGEQLAEAVDLRAGERVLDVAAGNGNATLAAARRFADVTSTDYVPALLDKGRARAEAEGLTWLDNFMRTRIEPAVRRGRATTRHAGARRQGPRRRSDSDRLPRKRAWVTRAPRHSERV